MRPFIFLLLLAACTPEQPPEIPSSSVIRSPRIRYDCAPDNSIVMIYTTQAGVDLEPMPTGESCDFRRQHPKDGGR